MFEKYLLCLFKQYCNARGLDINNTNSMNSNDFVDWIVQNGSLLNNYMNYLKVLGFDYQIDDVVEIGKGRYDSISKRGFNLISIFAETLEKNNSRLFVDRGMPLVLRNNSIIIPSEDIILTHNPYFESEVLNWYLIHNKGNKNISVGVFGNLSDEDVKLKIKLLEQLSSQMTEDYSFNYDTINDNYYCSLNSKRYIKRKVLTKTR